MRPSAGDKDRRPIKSPAGGIRRGSSDLASGASLRGEVPTYSECCTPVCSSPRCAARGHQSQTSVGGFRRRTLPAVPCCWCVVRLFFVVIIVGVVLFVTLLTLMAG